MPHTYGEEKRRHSSMLVPFSYYKCCIPDYFPSVALHWHSEFEINHIISGTAEFICGDERFYSKAGDIIVIPPNTVHAIYPVNDERQLYDTLVFSLSMLGLNDSDRCCDGHIRPLCEGAAQIQICIDAAVPYYDELKTTAENIFSCAKGNSAHLDLLMKSELMRFFWLLEESGCITPTSSSRGKNNELLKAVLEYINDNYSEPITVEQLAAYVHLSPSYFMKQFKSLTGTGAIEYLNRHRIKAACRLLKETDLSSAQTAFECGFRNISNFNRQFKYITGCSPTEYRKAEK